MSIEKEFIPYEQAYELKDLGFDEKCLAYYQSQRLKIETPISKSEKQPQIYMRVEDCTAPLYQQAFRWFREKYGLRIRNNIFVNMSGSISEGFEVFKYAKDTIDRVEALTYEEAELDCLKKLIEIVKNK